MWNWITTFIGSIPDVIWSGIIASTLTLSGVLIANRSNTTRLKLQLEHDSKENAKELTASLRKEVYLQSAEQLVKTNAYLAGLPQIDATEDSLGAGMLGFSITSAKLELVAEPKTALLASKLSGNYGELFLQLLTYLSPVQSAKSDIKNADELISNAQSELSRILGEMTRLNESGVPHPQIFNTLQSNYDFNNAQIEKYSKIRDDAWDRYNANHVKFQKFLLSQIRELSLKQIPLKIEIRRDLGLTEYLSDHEKELKDQHERMETRIDELLSTFQNDAKN